MTLEFLLLFQAKIKTRFLNYFIQFTCVISRGLTVQHASFGFPDFTITKFAPPLCHYTSIFLLISQYNLGRFFVNTYFDCLSAESTNQNLVWPPLALHCLASSWLGIARVLWWPYSSWFPLFWDAYWLYWLTYHHFAVQSLSKEFFCSVHPFVCFWSCFW